MRHNVWQNAFSGEWFTCRIQSFKKSTIFQKFNLAVAGNFRFLLAFLKACKKFKIKNLCL